MSATFILLMIVAFILKLIAAALRPEPKPVPIPVYVIELKKEKH